MGLAFTKVEGLGNDFLLLDRAGADVATLDPELADLGRRAPLLCHRRTGVGADGLLIVARGEPGADATMIVINHDGSRPQMCGNGVRCVALFLAGRIGKTDMLVATDAGPRRCTVTAVDEDGQRGQVRVDMGTAEDLGERHAAAAPGVVFRGIDVGNPHAIASTAEDPEVLARTLGPGVETDPAFPDRTNVEFYRTEPDGSLTLWVWERGVGITKACGTGACATAMAATLAGDVEPGRPITVHLPGGDLLITVPRAPGEIEMSGPAHLVFTGEA